MLFVLTPQYTSPVYDAEDIFHQYQRRSYVAALQEQQQRAAFERELAEEEQRHRIALASIARQEAARRRQSAHFARPAPSSFEGAYACEGGQGRRFCRQPAPEEIFARRQAREQEEEDRSRLFHEHILSQIFGQAPQSTEGAQPGTSAAPAAPTTSNAADKGKQSIRKQPLNEEPEPHWSAAPERAKSLAEIASINRTYVSLVNAFTFPTGPLEPLAGSDMPRLAFNTTNASIHAFEHALSELLTKLDGIESHGFRGVREARKQLVVKIGKRLEQLEQRIAERLSQHASPASVPVAVPEEIHIPVEEVTRQEKEVQDVEMADEPTTTVHDTIEETTAGYDVEPEEEPVEPVKDAVETAAAVPSQDMDVEVEHATIPVPDQSDSVSRPSSPVPAAADAASMLSQSTVEVNQSVPGPVHTTTNALEESTSDEESEIEDAVHVFVDSNDEATSHDQKGDASDQEVEFELV